MSATYDVHEMARRMVAQAPRPMTLSEAYAELGRRGAERRRMRYGRTTIGPADRQAFNSVETPARRLPYADND